MGRASGMAGEKRRVYIGYWWGNLMGRDHLEDLNIHGRKMQHKQSMYTITLVHMHKYFEVETQ